jgi:putative endonuclease
LNYWVYILLCENGAYYTGYTNDLETRYQQHLSGKGAKYTRSFKPIKIAQSWEVSDKSTAMKMEAHLKKLTRKEKEKMILNHSPLP